VFRPLLSGIIWERFKSVESQKRGSSVVVEVYRPLISDQYNWSASFRLVVCVLDIVVLAIRVRSQAGP